jgi:hypothetical protein
MTKNEIAIAGMLVITILASMLAYHNSYTEKQNAERFKALCELNAPR